ncbi:hypothetical protein A7981_05710 [Methylovorus sp. MM2]|uniref:phage tail fiber domain-containing protein n=1 Tax=Methylovorus sp. MM2 TaxID=1848038 RepID=UPI0007DFFA1B|nr:phage tail fiber protein [Methylovorus sp. MM2]OAM52929.1 hypothetical protein A7981_05710 [Methylovorus sp. MM2]
MAYSRVSYLGDGVNKLFSVTFPYIDPSHVTALVGGVSVPFTWISPSQIQITTAPGVAAAIVLQRNSVPAGRLVDFQDDSMATEALFNLNSDQLLFVAQEAIDSKLDDAVVALIQGYSDAAVSAAATASLKATQATAAVAAITLPIPLTSGGTGATTAAAARTALGLGSGATRAVGVAVGNVIEVLTGTKLPVLDGTNLTGFRQILQDSTVSVNTVLTGTALIPSDDTIPQNTEGFQLLTGAITPTAIGNKIVVEVNVSLSSSVANPLAVALFRDAGVDAVAVASSTGGVSSIVNPCTRYEFTATATSVINFYIRVGGSAAGTTTVNGGTALRRYGGALSSFMRMYEVKG